MRIYLDLCALKRPYDKPAEDRIVIEALAVAAIVKAFENGKLEMISSTVLELESKSPISCGGFRPRSEAEKTSCAVVGN